MKSIRQKLFIQIGILVTSMIILIIVVNSFLAEPYYLNRQKSIMVDYYEEIITMDFNNSEELKQNLMEIEKDSGMDILLYSEVDKFSYSSSGYINDERAGGNNNAITPQLEITEIEVIDENLNISRIRELNFGIENIVLSGPVNNTSYHIELRIPVHYIQTGIEIINEILIYIGIVFILISMIFSYILSKSFTKPILSINTATEKMKNLDFDVHCDITTEDELGQLSANINKMSESLSETIDTLDTRDRKRRILLNDVSHELKTPLTLMQGYATALKQNIIKNPEKLEFYSDVIIDESQKMNKLVENLLDIDQLETESRKLNLKDFNINELVSETYQKFTHMMEENNISHQLILSDETRVNCDPYLIEQVLKNLIINAITHINNGNKLEVSVNKESEKVKIKVVNSSERIDESELTELWTRFYKKDKSRTREHGGHGLGLSIVKAIQEKHNQEYGSENTDEGICFWFTVKKAD